MSVEAMTTVLRYLPNSGIIGHPTKRLLLLLLANRHNRDEGIAWPSLKTLSEESGIDDRSIRKHIRDLEEWGILKRVERRKENGAQTSNGYRFIGPLEVDPPVTRDLPPRSLETSPPGLTGPPPPVTRDLPPRSEMTGKLVLELGSEQTENKQQERAKVRPRPLPEPVQSWPKDRSATAWDLWKEHIGPGTSLTPNQVRDLLILEDEALATGKPELGGILEYAIKQTGKLATHNRFGYLLRVMRNVIDDGATNKGKRPQQQRPRSTDAAPPEAFEAERAHASNAEALARLMARGPDDE